MFPLTRLTAGLRHLTIASALVLGAAGARADTLNFTFFYTSPSGAAHPVDHATVATGSFSYAAGKTGVLGYGDLTSFFFSIPSLSRSFTLADVLSYSPATSTTWFAYDSGFQSFAAGSVAGHNTLIYAAPNSKSTGFDAYALTAAQTSGQAGVNNSIFSSTYVSWNSVTISAVPEPESYALMTAGLLALTLLGRRRQNQSA